MLIISTICNDITEGHSQARVEATVGRARVIKRTLSNRVVLLLEQEGNPLAGVGVDVRRSVDRVSVCIANNYSMSSHRGGTRRSGLRNAIVMASRRGKDGRRGGSESKLLADSEGLGLESGELAGSVSSKDHTRTTVRRRETGVLHAVEPERVVLEASRGYQQTGLSDSNIESTDILHRNNERREVVRLVGRNGMEARVITIVERARVVESGLSDSVILLFE